MDAPATAYCQKYPCTYKSRDLAALLPHCGISKICQKWYMYIFTPMMHLRPWQTRTHCCRHIVADTNVSPFARARNTCCGHKFCVRDTKMFLILFRNILCPHQMFPSLRSPRSIMGNNVSSFTRAFINKTWLSLTVLLDSGFSPASSSPEPPERKWPSSLDLNSLTNASSWRLF